MTIEAIPRSAALEMGRVISGSVAMLRGNLMMFGGVGLLLGALPALLTSWMEMSGSAAGGTVVSSVTLLVSQAILYPLAMAYASGRPAGAVTGHLGLMGPFFGINLLSGLGIIAGTLLLVVPGLILFCMWSVTKAARTAEGPGVMNALSRSAKLTQGNRWRIFALFLLLIVCFLVVAAIAGFAAGLFGGARAGEVAGTVAASVFTVVIPPAATTVLYNELRRAKEGVAPGGVASVFD